MQRTSTRTWAILKVRNEYFIFQDGQKLDCLGLQAFKSNDKAKDRSDIKRRERDVKHGRPYLGTNKGQTQLAGASAKEEPLTRRSGLEPAAASHINSYARRPHCVFRTGGRGRGCQDRCSATWRLRLCEEHTRTHTKTHTHKPEPLTTSSSGRQRSQCQARGPGLM